MPCRLAISSLSLGRAWLHKLPHKLDEAQRHGYHGIELFYEDLEYFAKDVYGTAGFTHCLATASIIRHLCDTRGLSIVSLGPFSHCEGLLQPDARASMFERLEQWMRLAHALGTDIIQIPSNFLPSEQVTGDMDVIVADLTEVAERGLRSGLRFAYECLCWGTHNDTWEHSWEIVKRVNRPNFGLCLDTYNIAGRVFADPTVPSGQTPAAEQDLDASMERLVAEVDVKKIFYVEVVDAERLECPINPEHPFYDSAQPPRMSWSRNCRLFYGESERGAYLPIRRVVKALLEKDGGLGFEGWVSFELFNRSLIDSDPEVPCQHASRGAKSWQLLQNDVDFDAAAPAYEKDTFARAGDLVTRGSS